MELFSGLGNLILCFLFDFKGDYRVQCLIDWGCDKLLHCLFVAG